LTLPSWSLSVQSTPLADVATLTANDTLGLAKGISIVITLPHDQPYVDVEWRVTDKTADPLPEGGWLCFPFAIEKPRFLLGRLGGPMDPAKDIVPGSNHGYASVNTGLTMTGKDETGIGLCPIDSPNVSLDRPGLWKYSMDFVPTKPTAFINLYNNMWNTNFPNWIDGSWTSRVRIWPIRGTDFGRNLVMPAWEARVPLLAAETGGAVGKLPATQTGVSVSRAGVLVTAFGKNPDSAGTLLRVWEQAGKSGEISVTIPGKFTMAKPVNLRGEKTGEPVQIRGGKLTINLPAYAPASFVLQ